MRVHILSIFACCSRKHWNKNKLHSIAGLNDDFFFYFLFFIPTAKTRSRKFKDLPFNLKRQVKCAGIKMQQTQQQVNAIHVFRERKPGDRSLGSVSLEISLADKILRATGYDLHLNYTYAVHTYIQRRTCRKKYFTKMQTQAHKHVLLCSL